MLTDKEALTKVIQHIGELTVQSTKYIRRWNTFSSGETLKKKEGADIKTHINFFYRFCKTHAAYVVKDAPNIQVPAEHPDQFESKMIAAKKERALNMAWKANSFVRKIKIAAFKGSIFGDMYFMVSYDKAGKQILLDILDPTTVLYDTEDNDPLSKITYLIRAKLVDVSKLKKDYPEFKDKIVASNMADTLVNTDGFTKSTLRSNTKAALFILMDDKYLYKVVNGTDVVETVEHGYGFIPVVHRPYIEDGTKYGRSLVDVLYEPVKTMHLALSFLITNAYDTAQPPLLATGGGNPTFDKKTGPKGLITLPQGSMMNYLEPPQSSADLYKVLDYAKVLMHFISGISEEAMAGFTGALTSAGVSIELRLDSTVREAIDSQIVLKDVLEKVNTYAFRLMSKFMKNSNLLKINDVVEYDKNTPFTGAMLGKNFYNIVDFGGILPRSETTLVNNVLAKKNAGLISLDTALEELRYTDPTLEMSKSMKEKIDTVKLEKALQSGDTSDVVGFEGPKEENYYMMVNNKIVPVSPEQNHQEHRVEHQQAYTSTNNPLILTHMMMHQKLMEGSQSGAYSQEMQQQMGNYQGQPMTNQQAGAQQMQPAQEEGPQFEQPSENPGYEDRSSAQAEQFNQ